MKRWALVVLPLVFGLALLSLAHYRPVADGQPQVVNGRIVLGGHLGSAHGDTEIYTLNPDGTDPQRLTDWPGLDNSARWSPDGSQLVFAHGAGAARDLWLMDASGSNLRQLTDDTRVETSPSWFPTGDRIVYISSPSEADIPCQPNCDGEILSLDIARSEITPITDNVDDESHVSVSPDGTRLALIRHVPETINGDLYLVDLTTGQETQIGDSDLTLWAPDWWSDGTKLVVAGQQIGTLTDSSIYTLDIATGTMTLLITGPYYGDPSWAPDGRQIVYNCNFRVCIINSDGSGNRVVGEFDNVFDPDWQPLFISPTPTPAPTSVSSPTPSPSPVVPRELPRTGGDPR